MLKQLDTDRVCVCVCVCGKGCEYGDRADWCSSYVKGESECRRQDIAAQCCQTCARYTGGNVRTTRLYSLRLLTYNHNGNNQNVGQCPT